MNRRDFLKSLGKSAPIIGAAAVAANLPKPEQPIPAPQIVEVEKVVERVVQKEINVTLAEYQQAVADRNNGHLSLREFDFIKEKFLAGTKLQNVEVVWGPYSGRDDAPVGLKFAPPRKDRFGREEKHNV